MTRALDRANIQVGDASLGSNHNHIINGALEMQFLMQNYKMEDMNIIVAQYENRSTIKATINGIEMHVPIAKGNRHYDEILRQVEAGTLVIAPADEE